MRGGALVVAAVVMVSGARVDAQSRTEPADVRCPSELGAGVAAGQIYCDILIQREASAGILVVVPPHRGTATLSFMLHNRHTYSEDEIQRGQGYAHYTAVVAVATVDGTILGRGAVQNEFRSAADLVDRVSGGAAPEGLKAIAPTGAERIEISIPADVAEVSIVGLRVDVVRTDRRESMVTPGSAAALMSDAHVTYRPR